MVLLIAIEDGELKKGSKIHCSLVCRGEVNRCLEIRMRIWSCLFALLCGFRTPGFNNPN